MICISTVPVSTLSNRALRAQLVIAVELDIQEASAASTAAFKTLAARSVPPPSALVWDT